MDEYLQHAENWIPNLSPLSSHLNFQVFFIYSIVQDRWARRENNCWQFYSSSSWDKNKKLESLSLSSAHSSLYLRNTQNPIICPIQLIFSCLIKCTRPLTDLLYSTPSTLIYFQDSSWIVPVQIQQMISHLYFRTFQWLLISLRILKNIHKSHSVISLTLSSSSIPLDQFIQVSLF